MVRNQSLFKGLIHNNVVVVIKITPNLPTVVIHAKIYLRYVIFKYMLKIF